MTQPASLALLTGKAMETDEVSGTQEGSGEAAEPEGVPTGEDVSDEEIIDIDLDAMTAKQVDAFIKEHEIDVPGRWWAKTDGEKKMTVAEKKAWIKETFDPENEDEDTETPEVSQLHPDTPQEPSTEVAVAPTPTQGSIEEPGQDLIADLVHEIENMSSEVAVKAVLELTDKTEMTMFKIGGILSLIQKEQWYEPYASFREFVETKLGMHYRKATYWSSIYNDLVEADVSWEDLVGVGWTKIAQIAPILTKENVAEWAQTAKEQTTLQLIETVKAFKSGDQESLPTPSTNIIVTKTFKLHSDQKETVESALEKAKDASGTDVDTAALEFICLDYLGGQSLGERMKKVGLEKVLEVIEATFPDAKLTLEMLEDPE